eukprot:snap_masked-scaffold_8-processed-gene-12.32-mRNA-1 protein AED:1.00 eAED:1.00 QI:0/0/0/0/1/1/2/0/76
MRSFLNKFVLVSDDYELMAQILADTLIFFLVIHYEVGEKKTWSEIMFSLSTRLSYFMITARAFLLQKMKEEGETFS